MHLHPGLHVFYASQIEDLVSQLAVDLAYHRHDVGPWQPVSLVVPNPNVKDYLRATLARLFGASANLRFHFLEGFWRSHLDPDRHPLDRLSLEGVLLGLFQDATTFADAALGPLARYLEGDPRDLKAVQLAQRVARIFERLQLHRPDWLRHWEAPTPRPPRDLRDSPTADWQAALWRRVRTCLQASMPPREPLPQLLLDSDFQRFPGTVFLFGMGHMAPLYHQALACLGRTASVRLYLVAPCRESWDGERPERLGTREAEDPYQLETDRGSLLLQRWARPGREQLRLLNEVAQGDFLGKMEVPPSTGNLAALQTRILDPETPAEPLLAPDDTLRVIPCPNPGREAEVVASLVWDWVQACPGRRFSDITVLVPPTEEDAYLTHLREAFQGTHTIPWTRALGASRALKAQVEVAGLLFGLATGDLTRADLLRAATHPLLAAHWPEADPGAWASLCARAGIVSRLDASETEGTYREGGTWTWARGFQRLALGVFMKESPTPGGPVGGQEASALVASLGALARDLRILSHGRQTIGLWVDRAGAFLRGWLVPDPATAEESASQALTRLLKSLEGLRDLELPSHTAPCLDFQAFRALAMGAFEGLLGDQALSPGRGVQVGCYTPLRAVPSGALFLMGLGEGLFPTSTRPDPLDLLADAPRRAGDVSPTEQDRHLFLESLMSCRESLVLSWPCQDALTGERLEPSPLLRDLEEALGKEAWGHLLLPMQPRHRFDARQFSHLHPHPEPGILPSHHEEARREAELRWRGDALRAALGDRDLPLRLADWGPTAQGLGDLIPPLGPVFTQAPPLPTRVILSFQQLKAWLECPVQGGEAFRLHLAREGEEDPADVSDDPLDTPFLEAWALRRSAFWDTVADPTLPPAAALLARRACLEADARAPLSPMADAEITLEAGKIDAWRTQGMFPAPPAILRFGRGLARGAEGLPILDHAPVGFHLDLGQGPLPVCLEGASDPMLPDGTFVLLTDSALKSGKPSASDQRQALRAWLAHVALCAQSETEARQALLVAPNGRMLLPFPPLAPQEAVDRLKAWVRDMVLEPATRLSPFEALFDEKAKLDHPDWVSAQLEGDRASLSSLRGPLPSRTIRDLDAEPDLGPAQNRLTPFPALQGTWSEA